MKVFGESIFILIGGMFILGGIFFGLAYATLSYQKTEHSMNNEYDVWFEGENAYELAANSDKLAYTRQSMRHLLNVGAEMELQEVVQHNFYGYRYIEPKINYNIQFANEQNEMISYRFSTLEHVKISYKNDISTPILKRIENDVREIKPQTTYPQYMNFIIYIPEKTYAMKKMKHQETCTGNSGNTNFSCKTTTTENK